MQANKLVCHISWKLAEDSWVRDEILDYSQYNRQHEPHVCPSSPCPKSLRTTVDSLGVTAEQSLTKEAQILYKGTARNLPTLCPRERHYLYNIREQTNLFSALEGATIFMLQGCLLYKHP